MPGKLKMRLGSRRRFLRELAVMRLWNSSLLFVVVALAATVCLLGGPPGQIYTQSPGSSLVFADPGAVVLPTSGTMDERPFFSSGRHPAIEYADSESTDAVGELARKVNAGAIRLRFEKTSGYLLSVLEALRIPVESQGVIFSKTSLQSHYISPSNPRAIFFSDNVTIGFIRNAPLLELSAQDPKQGVVFYALEQKESERPQIVRGDSCLSCH